MKNTFVLAAFLFKLFVLLLLLGHFIFLNVFSISKICGCYPSSFFFPPSFFFFLFFSFVFLLLHHPWDSLVNCNLWIFFFTITNGKKISIIFLSIIFTSSPPLFLWVINPTYFIVHFPFQIHSSVFLLVISLFYILDYFFWLVFQFIILFFTLSSVLPYIYFMFYF